MIKDISNNKKAYHDYEILEKYEAGIVLRGVEIKAIRARKVNISGSHARIMQIRNSKHEIRNKFEAPNSKFKTKNQKSEINLELFIINLHIGIPDGEKTRTRKLLMHKKEISRLIGKTQEKRLTLVPLRLYLKNGKAKIELGLGRGKKLYDKREDLKKRDLDREVKLPQ